MVSNSELAHALGLKKVAATSTCAVVDGRLDGWEIQDCSVAVNLKCHFKRKSATQSECEYKHNNRWLMLVPVDMIFPDGICWFGGLLRSDDHLYGVIKSKIRYGNKYSHLQRADNNLQFIASNHWPKTKKQKSGRIQTKRIINYYKNGEFYEIC